MYDTQHPAEATLDYLISTLRSHTRTDHEKVHRCYDAIETYFDWSAERRLAREQALARANSD